MLCYKDRAFCARSKSCANTECSRHTGREDFQPGDLPVSYSNFENCKEYKEKEKVK